VQGSPKQEVAVEEGPKLLVPLPVGEKFAANSDNRLVIRLLFSQSVILEGTAVFTGIRP
jgi:hypothetical protein